MKDYCKGSSMAVSQRPTASESTVHLIWSYCTSLPCSMPNTVPSSAAMVLQVWINSFFLSVLVWRCLLLVVSVQHCLCTWSHSKTGARGTTHTQWDSSGRLIGPSQRPPPGNTQHPQQTVVHAPSGIRIRIPSNRSTAEPRLKPRGHWDLALD